MPNPYCQKRKGTWYFRLRLPADLAPVLGRQVIRSLGTGRAGEARMIAAGLAASAPSWWDVLRRMAMATILGKPISELRFEDLTRENLARMQRDLDGMDAEARGLLGEKLDALLRAGFLASKQGEREVRVAELALDMMRDGQARGRQEGLERAIALGAGAAPPSSPNSVLHGDPSTPRADGTPDGRRTMRQILPEFFERRNAHGDKSRVSYEGAISKFEEIIGKRPIQRITEADIQKFVDVMLSQPGRAGRKTAAHATVEKNLSHVRTLLEWAATGNRRWIPSNPAATAELPQPDEDDDGTRDAFTHEQLVKIFRSPLFTGHAGNEWSKAGPHLHRQDRFYFFAVMFLAGARNTELAGSGLVNVGGVECLDLTKTGTKTGAAKRYVPLLPELHRMGFVDWAKARLAAGGELFKGEHAVKKWTDFPSRYLTDISVSGERHSAYSLRHSHRQMLRGSGINQDLMDKTFGHRPKGASASYAPGPIGPQEARLWLEKVTCPIDLSHLYIE